MPTRTADEVNTRADVMGRRLDVWILRMGQPVAKTARSSTARKSTRQTESPNRRKVIVFTSLVGVLTLTSALLLALEPAQLRPDHPAGLFAIDQRDPLETVFDTHVTATPGHWKYIYVHHSATSGAAAMDESDPAAAGDHFIIGNGDGSVDGSIEIAGRWVDQKPAAPPAGARNIDPSCISVCLVGDFHQNLPTPLQMQRLQQLVCSLQAKYQIGADNVLMLNNSGGSKATDVGRYFPVTAFRGQLLR